MNTKPLIFKLPLAPPEIITQSRLLHFRDLHLETPGRPSLLSLALLEPRTASSFGLQGNRQNRGDSEQNWDLHAGVLVTSGCPAALRL